MYSIYCVVLCSNDYAIITMLLSQINITLYTSIHHVYITFHTHNATPVNYTYKNAIQCDPVYLYHKDLKHSIYQATLVRTKIYKTSPFSRIELWPNMFTYTASLLGKF